MTFQTKHIEINPSNVKIFLERYANGISLQPFVNSLLEKYFAGRIVEMNDHNYSVMIALSHKLNEPPERAVNLALESVEWGLDETPKPRIQLDVNKKKIKAGKKIQVNKITNF